MGILLTLAYDGTNYCGWQMQKNGISVSQKLEVSLSNIITNFSILGASRTDAGVHALGQCVHVILSSSLKIPINKLPQVINSLLPEDIRVVAARFVPDSFHPINDAKSKTYNYKIYNAKYLNPLTRLYEAHIPVILNIEAMSSAAVCILGRQDFAAFCSSGSSVKSTIRTIFNLDIYKDGCTINININGDGFLYNMVRIIAGTLVDVGQGKTKENSLFEIIKSKDRKKAGKTMPPHGLTLVEIFY